MQSFHFTIFNKEFSLADTSAADTSAQAYLLQRGQTLLRNFQQYNITTRAKCGGKAICGRCRVKVLSGHEYCNKAISEENIILTREELKQGWRLACQLYCLKDISIFIPSGIE